MTTKKRDYNAPATLFVEIKAADGQVWRTLEAGAKEFKTGSVGFYAGDKISNPANGEMYQVTMSIVLIGSKG